MNRPLIVFAAAAVMVGCGETSHTGQSSSTAMESNRTAQISSAGGSAANASTSAKPATPAKIYPIEVPRRGNVYVFNSPDAASQFVQTKTPPVGMVEKAGMGPNGETVYFEGGPVSEALVAEYQKLHPKK